MTIDHVSVQVPEAIFQDCLKFYLEALKPLGYELIHQFGDTVVGLGSSADTAIDNYKFADFWLTGVKEAPQHTTHIAFRAKDRQSIDSFHKQALATGGKDNGAPGLRTHYHPHYYGAFVFDPAGNNVEAVTHKEQ
ncbi:hypothetical protein PT974_09874 [Cladobotryum mycophilum]|uniref:VOC domain-containing protein n=1 Tax=Cladobotryum mycophilum TaxID=491253 RepID=A0ABR0SHE5_9HYPO